MCTRRAPRRRPDRHGGARTCWQVPRGQARHASARRRRPPPCVAAQPAGSAVSRPSRRRGARCPGCWLGRDSPAGARRRLAPPARRRAPRRCGRPALQARRGGATPRSSGSRRPQRSSDEHNERSRVRTTRRHPRRAATPRRPRDASCARGSRAHSPPGQRGSRACAVAARSPRRHAACRGSARAAVRQRTPPCRWPRGEGRAAEPHQSSPRRRRAQQPRWAARRGAPRGGCAA
mmetsp:Transcript_25027/g.62014  ORF Transcript_25027/g.62014 Transcript_25027/m.62014 type:complete len:234 (-) Transcript_25027:158-859(-)